MKPLLCQYCGALFLAVLSEICFAVMFVFLKLIIEFIEEPDAPLYEGAVYAGLFILFATFATLLRHNFMFTNQRITLVLRKSITGSLYRKMLRISQKSVAKASAGKIINLASGDMTIFERSMIFLPFVFIAPIVAVAMLIEFAILISPKVLYIIIIIALFVVMQIFSNKCILRYRVKTGALTDARIRVLSELISGIRTLKAYAWELPLVKKIQRSRVLEIRSLYKIYCIKALLLGIAKNAAMLMFFPVLIIFVETGDRLKAGAVFALFGLMNRFTMSAIVQLSLGATGLTDFLAFMKRLNTFF